MALIYILTKVKATVFSIVVMMITFGLIGCTEKEDLDINGDEFFPLLTGQVRQTVNAEGGTMQVKVQIPKPFVYGTTSQLPRYEEEVNHIAFKKFNKLTYHYYPEEFTYHSDDIVNLVPSADGDRFLVPTEAMLAAGVTTLDNATEFDYKWIHVSVAEDAVTITAEPNDTGEYRNIILLFLLDSKDVFYFNNVIEIMQPAKAAG